MYAVIGAYLVLGPGTVPVRKQILGVVLSSVVWGVLVARRDILPPPTPGDAGFPPDFFFALQGLLLFSWYALLHRLLRGPYDQSMPTVVKQFLRLFWLIVLGISALAYYIAFWDHTPLGTFFSAAIASIALVCLALAAQLDRAAPVENRTALRSLVAAAGVATGAQATLSIVSATGAGVSLVLLGGVGALITLSGGLLLFALRLRPQWSLAIFVSPEARSYASRIFATGSILLLVLLLWPVFRPMAPGFPQQLAFWLVIVLGSPVVVLLFSSRLNARLRVVVTKHFLPFRYDYREEWLRLIDTLVSRDSGEPLPERVIRSLAQIVSSPSGLLWMRAGEGGHYSVAAGWNTQILPDADILSDDPALVFMLKRQWTIDTAELVRRPDLYGGLVRPEWLTALPEALLLVPLLSNADLIGLIVLFQSSSAFRLTFEEIDLLRTSGRQVAAFLAQYEADQKLAEGRQFEAFNRLTAFIMHDLKNLIAQQSLMVQNAAKHKGNPAFFEDAIATINNSVTRMSKLLQQLQSGEATGPRQRVRTIAAVTEAVDRCQTREPVPEVFNETDGAQLLIDRERLVTVLAHLIRNAQEASSRDGRVTVRIAVADNSVFIDVADDGCGMESEFIRARLFRPFDTTKGSQGMGIGAYQARTFIMESGGSLRVYSSPNQGSRFSIQLPLYDSGSGLPVP